MAEKIGQLQMYKARGLVTNKYTLLTTPVKFHSIIDVKMSPKAFENMVCSFAL